MSVREDIALDIVQKLSNITSPNVVLVTRNPFTVSDLAATQFPAIFVRTTDEDREDFTQNGLRQGVINYQIVASVQADSSATSINNNVDTKRNEIIEAISEKLEEDTARNSKALHSEITGVTVDDGTTFPVGQATITYSVQYKYTRGTN
jgi:hypothetical protein